MKYVLLVLMLFSFVLAQEPDQDIIAYKFELDLNDENDSIKGKALISIRPEKSCKEIRLDLVGTTPGEPTGMTVFEVQLDGKLTGFDHQNDRLVIPISAAQWGDTLHVAIRYAGIPADGLIISKTKFGDRSFFGDNWPDRAQHWLPVEDHPADKAFCEFIVTAPSHYQVVGNGALQEETDLANGDRLTHWKSTVPLPTKVMVIGAARFAVQQLPDIQDIPLSSWVYPQNREAGFFDYRQADSILAFFIQNIGPYPYAKLANVQSKTRYGGMENASNIFYMEGSVTGERKHEPLLAHEIAHQWFGNSATEADWPHIWLSEGFATYFTHLYNEYTYGKDRMRVDMQKDKARIQAFIKMAPNATVVDTQTTELIRLLNPNSYEKGGWVLHMIRYEVGDEDFWKGIRTYYERFHLKNAITADLQQVMEEVSGKELGWLFQQWLYYPGIPEVGYEWKYNEASQSILLELTQTQQASTVFRLPIEVEVTWEDRKKQVKLVMDQPQQQFTIKARQVPESVSLDPEAWLLVDWRPARP
ncbi:MAG: M1 family aminopeptidase [Bacteroidota bacterium]